MFSKNCFEIQYSKKFPFVKISKNNLFVIFFIAVLVGLFAFIFETLLDYITMDILFDRGFLIGPFIPIYFFVVFFGLLYVKTPKASFKNYFLYALGIGISISAVEFVVGNVCELLFHEVLWTYDGFVPFSYKYVSLTVALFWGLAGSALLMFIVPLLKRKVEKIPHALRYVIVIGFFTLFISDVIASLVIVIKNNWQYRELYRFNKSIELTLFLIGLALYILLVILFAKFLYKNVAKLKKTALVIYLISVLIPIFSLKDYLNRFSNPFLLWMSQAGFVIAAFYIYFILSLIIVLIIRQLAFVFSKKEFFKSTRCKNYCLGLSFLSCIVIIMIGLCSIAFPKTKTLQIGQGKQEMNIVAIGDVHYGSPGTSVDLNKLVYHINALNPDLVLFIGDVFDNKVEYLDHQYFCNAMKQIKSRYGSFAITGNHEYEYNYHQQIVDFYHGSGVQLLVDDYLNIGNEILLVGRQDFIYQSRKKINEIIPTDNSLPIVLLDHQPQAYQEAFDNHVLLQLSAHTHNGQLFPFNYFVKLYSSIRYQCDKINGHYQEEDSHLYITKGYGSWGFPLRTTGRSEIVQITLKY